jgi:Tol biopolymer transport system component
LTVKKILLLILIALLSACAALGERSRQPAENFPASLTPGLGQGLSGRLLLVNFSPAGSQLIELDLTSGQVHTLFQAPEGSWLGSARMSPDGRQILLAYAPPASEGRPQFGYSDLYLLAADGSGKPQPLLERERVDESFFHPTWAPDGKSIYFTHLYWIEGDNSASAFQNDILRADIASGVRTVVVESALWPAVSPDGSSLAYLTADPRSQANDLYLTDQDGSSPTPVVMADEQAPVDEHLFTVDGEGLIFSMVNTEPAASSSWWERFFGTGVALAHSVPSDWYSISLEGGEPVRLTQMNDIGLSGDLSPDGNHLAFISATGFYVMRVDGSELTRVMENVTVGTVDWVP